MNNMSGYKVVYKDEVFNCLYIEYVEYKQYEGNLPPTGENKPKFITVVIINKDGQLVSLHDEAWTFQFIREVKAE